jgi:hypothetical protein
MPDLVEGPAGIEARALGHPLLAAGSRVNNDVSVGPPGTFVFVQVEASFRRAALS